MPNDRRYLELVAHYEDCLAKHGDSHRGVDWPNRDDAEKRYDVMLDVAGRDARPAITLLDFGCGASHLNERIRSRGLDGRILYSGLDLSAEFVALSRKKFPGCEYYQGDLLEDDSIIPEFDYIVMNGVFTEKRGLGYEEMWEYFQTLLCRVFAKARTGIAFNVMSKQVDWERDDLFHVPFDRLAAFLTARLTRHFVFRHDYRLYEYTTYVYR